MNRWGIWWKNKMGKGHFLSDGRGYLLFRTKKLAKEYIEKEHGNIPGPRAMRIKVSIVKA